MYIMSNRGHTQTPPPPASPHLGWALATVMRDYQKQVEAALVGLPGGGRAFLVMSVVKSEACQSQIAIAERISLDKTTLTYLLDGLEHEDLIQRVSDPNDRRSRHIKLTPKGLEALAGFTQAVDRVEQGMLARLGADEAARFKTSLTKVAGLDDRAETVPADQEDSAHICQTVIGANEAC